MKSVCHFLIFCSLFLISYSAFAQPFTHADTLRGSNGPGREWWDVQHYGLNVKFNLNDSSISGYNDISFEISRIDSSMQIDLQEPLIIDSFCIVGSYAETHDSSGNAVGYVGSDMMYPDKRNDSNTYFLKIPTTYIDHSGKYYSVLRIYYHGKPHIAKNAPWDGGMVWTKDKLGRPWISFACQGIGASCWFPCKDYQGDEPDHGTTISIEVPDSLTAIANGVLVKEHSAKRTTIYTWNVSAPINTYDIVPYIGYYVNFHDIYNYKEIPISHNKKTQPQTSDVSSASAIPAKKFTGLEMSYWVLDYNLDKAKKQFKDAPKMMKAFEYWFGPYPFYDDSYKLVDAPYLGMENQSDIAYGNGYTNGYLGHDLSASGWGLKWDFIIVHESAHEWFGNNITCKDIADMWIHEGFANYAEALFTEYYYGKEAGDDYVIGLRKNIVNDVPIIAPYGVNKEGSEDMYWKAANMIHTIRQVINNDSLFRQILIGLNKTFYHQTVTTQQIESYISTQSKIDFSKVFDQYLRTIQIPTLEYKIQDSTLSYHWTNCVPGFNLPLKINFKGEQWIMPTEEWKKINVHPEGSDKFSVDRNFYINIKKVD
jgi:aminopeptidase N